jgi:dUTP pyrophosphatase
MDEQRIQVKIISQSGILPAYETIGSAGMDVRAFLKESIHLAPGERALVPTGIRIELPLGLEAQIRARSGLSIRHGLAMVNGVGTIDSDYRGEIMLPVINLGDENILIENGDRLAQMVIARYERVIWEPTTQLNETERSGGGFGHTGIKEKR